MQYSMVLGMAALVIVIWNGQCIAGAPEGRNLALEKCQACHGKDGLAIIPEAPHLAGQSAKYLRIQLFAFKKGLRSHEMMDPVARELSRQDIFDLADWFSSIEISVKVPGR